MSDLRGIHHTPEAPNSIAAKIAGAAIVALAFGGFGAYGYHTVSAAQSRPAVTANQIAAPAQSANAARDALTTQTAAAEPIAPAEKLPAAAPDQPAAAPAVKLARSAGTQNKSQKPAALEPVANVTAQASAESLPAQTVAEKPAPQDISTVTEAAAPAQAVPEPAAQTSAPQSESAPQTAP